MKTKPRRLIVWLLALALAVTGLALPAAPAHAGGAVDLGDIVEGRNTDGTITAGSTVYVTMASLQSVYGSDFSTLYANGDVDCVYEVGGVDRTTTLKNGKFSCTTTDADAGKKLAFYTTAKSNTYYNNNTAWYNIVADDESSSPYTIETMENGGVVKAKKTPDTLYKVELSTGAIFTLSIDGSDQNKRQVKVFNDSKGQNIVYSADWKYQDHEIDITLPAGKYYFMVSIESPMIKDVGVYWTKDYGNNTLADALAFSVKEGTTKSYEVQTRSGVKYYYWLKVTPDSNKYTFYTTEKAAGIWLMKGKSEDTAKSLFSGSNGKLKESGDMLKQTLILQPGVYTIVLASAGHKVKFSVKNTAFNGLTELGGSSSIVIPVNKSKTYTLKMTPADNESKVTVTGNGTNILTIKTLSKSEYKITAGAKITTKTIKFTTNDGFTKKVTVKIGPSAPTISSEGKTTETTLTMKTAGATKYLIYQEIDGKYVKIGSKKANSSGTAKYTVTGLKAGKKYNFKCIAYADSIQGGATKHVAVTAYNVKPSNVTATCTKSTYTAPYYHWKWNDTSDSWYKVWEGDYTMSAITVKYTKPTGASYVEVNFERVDSGKVYYKKSNGKLGSGKTATLSFVGVRKSGSSIAYGPAYKKTVTLKAAS